MSLNWSYGVTTHPSRRTTELPRSLQSLAKAGFDHPILFVDECNYYTQEDYQREFQHLSIVPRETQLSIVGNWILALWELYIREPWAERYAIFQDDILVSKNLRQYLEETPYPDKGYLNLYTFPHNQPDRLAVRTVDGKLTHPGLDPYHIGFYPSCQFGKGALGLVFNRDAMMDVLANKHTVNKPCDPWKGNRSVDGMISEGMKKVGYTEYVHNPSLMQHTGDVSALGNGPHAKAESFKGEDYDLMQLFQINPNGTPMNAVR